MNQRQRFLTPEGSARLREELEDLKTVRRPDVSARIHIATEGGGTVDNAEYEEVKNEQAFVEGRIRDLEQVLSNAVVAERSLDAGDRTQIGSSSVKARTVRGSGRETEKLPVGRKRGGQSTRRQNFQRIPGR